MTIKKFNLRNVRGTHDLLGNNIKLINYIKILSDKLFNVFGYKEIQTPVLEYLTLFQNTIGLYTDIIEKEIYIFPNKVKKNIVCLRAENTVPVIRSLINNKILTDLTYKDIFKYFYIGSMFRKDRPQKGRLRQFNQLGVELIGANVILGNVEIISLLNSLLKNFKIKNTILIINFLKLFLELHQVQLYYFS